jgi:hypothetical protein
MNGRLCVTVLCAGYCGARMASVGFGEAARLPEVVARPRDAEWNYRALGVANELAFETFCCEVKHHG